MLAILTKTGLKNIRENNEEIKSQIKNLEEQLIQKSDKSNITLSSNITTEGYITDARTLNPSITGSLANRITTLEEKVKIAGWTETSINTFSTGFRSINEWNGIACFKHPSGLRRIQGIITVDEGFQLPDDVIFTVSEEFKSGNKNLWSQFTSLDAEYAITVYLYQDKVRKYSTVPFLAGHSYNIDLIY